MEMPADGALCHAEIPTDDVERAKKFYAEAFGWTFQDIPEMSYTIFRTGQGGIGGGFMKRNEKAPTHPVNYVSCDDLDATIARVEKSGGRILAPKMEVGDAGWMAHAADTEGNVIGLWQGKGGA